MFIGHNVAGPSMINSNSRVGPNLQWARFKIELLDPWYGCEYTLFFRAIAKWAKSWHLYNWPDRMYLAQCAHVYCKWMALQLSGPRLALALIIISVVTLAWVLGECILSWWYDPGRIIDKLGWIKFTGVDRCVKVGIDHRLALLR